MKPILISLAILAIIMVSISGGTNHRQVDKVVTGSVALKGDRVIKH